MHQHIRRTLGVVLLLALLLTSCAAPAPAPYIWPDAIDDVQNAHLQKLCKVWGFVKFHHPAVVNGGEADWDQALLDIFPAVLETRDTGAVNALLSDWVGALGPAVLKEGAEDAPPPLFPLPPEVGRWVSPLMEWIKDEEYLGVALSRQLVELSQLRIANRNMPLDRIGKNVLARMPFYWEETYSRRSQRSAGHRMLGLFRYWNAFAYYSPYSDLMDEDWEAVLARMIPKMLSPYYLQCLFELTAATQDGHAGVFASDILQESFGSYLPPVLFTQVEGQIVIHKISPEYEDACPLRPGDIVLALDGTPIAEVIERQIQYVSVPFPDKVAWRLQYTLFRTDKTSMQFRVLRYRQEMELDVPCLRGRRTLYRGDALPSHEWVEEGIGLINPGFLKKDEMPSILEEFRDADGIIVDLRQYPAVPLAGELAAFAYMQNETYALLRYPDYSTPGEFMLLPREEGEENPDYYRGKLVLLIDQTSMSQPEYTTMVLRKSPSAIVMGENSLGADGDIVGVPLPGGYIASFSGLGVLTPEGGQTQRIGVAPDIYVPRTIEGIREGGDELMEAAIAYVLE